MAEGSYKIAAPVYQTTQCYIPEDINIQYHNNFNQKIFCSTGGMKQHTLLSGTSELERVFSRDMMAVTARVTMLMSSSPSISAGAEFSDSWWQSSCFCSTKHSFMTLTPWRRVLLEKLTSLQLVKKFPAFYGT